MENLMLCYLAFRWVQESLMAVGSVMPDHKYIVCISMPALQFEMAITGGFLLKGWHKYIG
jgi:hypothetical protein